MIEIDALSLKYLNIWCEQLAQCISEIERHVKFWEEHIPKDALVLEDGISGINTIRFDKSDNSFTLEMVISSSIIANGNPCKLIYNCREASSNEVASHLITQYSIYFNYVLKALGCDLPKSLGNSFSCHLKFAKLLVSTGLKLTTIPQ